MIESMPKPVPRVPAGDQSDNKRERQAFDVSLLTTSELLNLRSRIDEALPPMKLGELNLEEELVRQFQTVRALQTETLEDKYVEANKKATVASACAATLGQIVKLQTDLYTAERFKAIEGLLIRTIRKLPLEVVEEFLNEYEKLGRREL